MHTLRKVAASSALAAGLVVAMTGTASARPITDTNPNPGGGTVGLDCVYDSYTGGETCSSSYAPTRPVQQEWSLRNPFTALWDDLSGWF